MIRKDKQSIMQRFPKGVDAFVSICLTTLKNPVNKIKRVKRLNEVSSNNKVGIKHYKEWKKLYKTMLLENNSPKCDALVEEFYNAEITLVKSADVNLTVDDIVLFCALKNEELRIREFINYHRNIGIKKFVIVDNDSNDGTIPYLMEQADVTIYNVKSLYDSTKKCAWMNRVIDIEGMDRYCLVLDADELFVYEDMENQDVNTYAKKLSEKNVEYIKGFMLNMYPDIPVDEVDLSNTSFAEAYCYFDEDSDNYVYDLSRNRLYGGEYKRITNMNYAMISKTPLFLAKNRLVFSSHEMYPFHEERDAKFACILKHYKFLPGEKTKVKEIAQKGNYAEGSKIYKHFEKIYDETNMNLYFEGSVKWEGSSTDNLKKFPVIKMIDEL